MFDSVEFRKGEYRAVLNARGLYNSMQFVMRLSPDVHSRISNYESGILDGSQIRDFEDINAFSTVLHETIHWWQHIGSSTGLIMSLSYPAQCHAVFPYLKQLTSKIGAQKSLRLLIESESFKSQSSEVHDLANRIVNTCYDIGFFQTLVTNPEFVTRIIKDPLYECEGHSYEIAYTNILAMLVDRADKRFELLPDPRDWEGEFKKLKKAKVKGYYYKSDISLANIGTKQIFEGQARFSQLQYLHGAIGDSFSWTAARERGMLDGVYVEAFNLFLKITNFTWPNSIRSSIVGLFLLICDISINPGAGFPEQIRAFETFIVESNPGKRFIALCMAVKANSHKYSNSISNYSQQEYITVAEELAQTFKWTQPQRLAELTSGWVTQTEQMKTLMNHYKTFKYPPENLPPALLLSQYLAFNEDRAKTPEFFCWPGIWLTSHKLSERSLELYNKHAAIFVDKEDNDGIFPRLMRGKDVDNVQNTFAAFYQFVVTYDMILQWITKPGQFQYTCHKWLFTTNATHENAKKYADSALQTALGVNANDFTIVPE